MSNHDTLITAARQARERVSNDALEAEPESDGSAGEA